MYLDRATDPDWPADLSGALVFIIPALGFREWARRLYKKRNAGHLIPAVPSAENKPALEQPRGRQFPKVIFWLCVAVIPLPWIAMLADDDSKSTEAFANNWKVGVIATIFVVLFALSAYGWSHAKSSDVPPRRRLSTLC